MSGIFRLATAVSKSPQVEDWFLNHDGELGAIARQWFDVMRKCGDDVRETLHDGQPTACVGDVAFAYVDSFTAHVNVGFFCGSSLADPFSMLQGSGKYMRHVKIGPQYRVDETQLTELINNSYADIKQRLL
jgi:hypothetical protein